MQQDIATVKIWTIGVQLGAAALLALFFVVLLRAQRLDAIRVWCVAWLAEALAISAAITIIVLDFPVVGEPVGLGSRVLLAVLLSAKIAYGLFAWRGARLLSADGEAAAAGLGPAAAAALVVGTLLAATAPSVRFTLPILWTVVAVAFLAGASSVLRWRSSSEPPLLGWVMLACGILYLLHVPPTAPYFWGEGPLFPWMDHSSVIDAAADMLLGLAVLVTLEQANSERLREANRRLEASREELRQMVDLDPLTGLRNRRGLRHVLDHLSSVGGAVIFLDVDDFKRINDRHGHVVGDRCLIAVARVLERSFRARDTLFRWGGDEFLVVAPELSVAGAQARLDAVRDDLARASEGEPVRATVSVGIGAVAPGEDAGTVLREADRDMYAEKRPPGAEPAYAHDGSERREEPA